MGGVGAGGLQVQGSGEAFLRACEVEERGAQDGFEGGVGVVERGGEAGEPLQALLLLVERDEDRALAPKEVDVAGEAVGSLLGSQIEVELEVLEVVGIERPRVAFRGEYGRTCGVEGAQSLEQGRVQLGFGDAVEVVGIGPEIDELADARMRRVVVPWDDEDGIVG